MRKFLLLLFTVFTVTSAFSRHIVGGELMYEYVSYNAGTNSYTYKLILRLFRDAQNCSAANNCADLPMSAMIGIYNNDNGQRVGSYIDMPRTDFLAPLPIVYSPPCLTNSPVFYYEMATYTVNITVPLNTQGYTAAFQTCCWVGNITNLGNSDGDRIGSTNSAIIPGTNNLAAGGIDRSPKFQPGISVICYNQPFQLDFSASDIDGDSLSYSFTSPYNGGGATDAGWSTPAGPPYGTLGFTGNYSGGNPFGTNAVINPNTGIITGTAPAAGKYLVSVQVRSYRNGNYISTHRKDFLITVAPCNLAKATLNPTYTSCDGFTVTLENESSSPVNQTFYWDLGDGSTSTQESPTHTYEIAGDYNIKLVVNRGTPCADSATAVLKVYPGFFPGINAPDTVCINTPVQFQDGTTLNYGETNAWHWDFGVSGTLADTSIVKNPVFTYTQAGNYTVSLNVSSNKGCNKTITKNIVVSTNVDLHLAQDTIMCINNPIQLFANGGSPGTYTWTPATHMDNPNIQNPTVNPPVTTTYSVNYVSTTGCTGNASIVVNVITQVDLSIMPDTTICRTDSVRLNVQTNGVAWQWTPAATLDNPNIKSPMAGPTAPSTTYTVVSSVGSCTATKSVTVKTVPYPVANAGPDQRICGGNSTLLTASGGSHYEWTPTLFLSNPQNQTTQVVQPQYSMNYTVKVTDTLGCPKPDYDTVFVEVININANAGPSDTNVVINQPLQLSGTGAGNIFIWEPATWLSDATVANPVALPQNDITYTLTVTNDIGCIDKDTIRVHLFNMQPDLLIPSAFTPGNDGLNDIIRPIPVGIRKLEFFRIYNRYGELIYSTSEIGQGWNGKYKGADQSSATFVWQVSAIDYLGRKIFKKGTVILIR